VDYAPTYFGSSEYEARPDFIFVFQYFRLPDNTSIGSTDPSEQKFGFGPRGSLRFVKDRSSSDFSELEGLDDIDRSVEIGLGYGYRQRNFRAFADVRYGVIGHQSWVGELGADYVTRPLDDLLVTFGPRLFLTDGDYADTYFGVTSGESAASGGNFDAFNASGGVQSGGLRLNALYALNDKWGLVGSASWDRLLNDAASSPITAQGSEDQFQIQLGVTRVFSIDLF